MCTQNYFNFIHNLTGKDSTLGDKTQSASLMGLFKQMRVILESKAKSQESEISLSVYSHFSERISGIEQ